MKVIGLTGGVGSGKSFIAGLICDTFDVLHINTDNIARRQMKKGGASYDGVVAVFGEGILGEDGEIDRGRLSEIVFTDADKLATLNSLTHPNVTATVKALIEAARDDYDGVLVETAILKEAGYIPMCDEIWFVRAPLKDRIDRVVKSRGYSRERAEATVASQAGDEEFESYATRIIDNPNGATPEQILNGITV